MHPHQVGRLWAGRAHALRLRQRAKGEVAVRAQVQEQPLPPQLRLRVPVGGGRRHVAERGHLRCVGAARAEAAPQRLVRDGGDGEVQPRHVEALRGRCEEDQALAQARDVSTPAVRRQQAEHRAEGGPLRLERHLSPHLVRADDNVALDAKPRDALEVVAAPAAARGVVRVAEVQQPRRWVCQFGGEPLPVQIEPNLDRRCA
mmetsp:Transcript_36076/g.115483  ORF Transcript_36076/g.115483 Transcript_36076/m.115483 type:complete len:202 (-) Transcript_36076:474-1079(-)